MKISSEYLRLTMPPPAPWPYPLRPSIGFLHRHPAILHHPHKLCSLQAVFQCLSRLLESSHSLRNGPLTLAPLKSGTTDRFLFFHSFLKLWNVPSGTNCPISQKTICLPLICQASRPDTPQRQLFSWWQSLIPLIRNSISNCEEPRSGNGQPGGKHQSSRSKCSSYPASNTATRPWLDSRPPRPNICSLSRMSQHIMC